MIGDFYRPVIERFIYNFVVVRFLSVNFLKTLLSLEFNMRLNNPNIIPMKKMFTFAR